MVDSYMLSKYEKTIYNKYNVKSMKASKFFNSMAYKYPYKTILSLLTPSERLNVMFINKNFLNFSMKYLDESVRKLIKIYNKFFYHEFTNRSIDLENINVNIFSNSIEKLKIILAGLLKLEENNLNMLSFLFIYYRLRRMILSSKTFSFDNLENENTQSYIEELENIKHQEFEYTDFHIFEFYSTLENYKFENFKSFGFIFKNSDKDKRIKVAQFKFYKALDKLFSKSNFRDEVEIIKFSNFNLCLKQSFYVCVEKNEDLKLNNSENDIKINSSFNENDKDKIMIDAKDIIINIPQLKINDIISYLNNDLKYNNLISQNSKIFNTYSIKDFDLSISFKNLYNLINETHTFCNIKILILENCKFNKIPNIEKCYNLIKVNLDYCDLEGKLKELTDKLSKLKKINTLSLNNCNIGIYDIKYLTDYLSFWKSKCLINLYLEGNNINQSCLPFLKESLIKNKTLKKLSLNSNVVTKGNNDILNEFFSNIIDFSLEEFSYNYCDLSQDIIINIKKILKKSFPTQFKLLMIQEQVFKEEDFL